MTDDTSVMHPFFAAIMAAFKAANRPQYHHISPQDGRDMLRAGRQAAPPPSDLPTLASMSDFAIYGPHGAIPVRSYVPVGPVQGTCLYLHAGGWVIGDLDFCDATCRRLAAAAGCEIISVDYRLAPEFPYPVPLDDCYAALLWAAKDRLGKIAIMGESAGGNLAAACAIRARDEGGPAIAAQVLAYPVTDHDFATASYLALGDRGWMLSTADMRWFWDQYCPAGMDRLNPLLSPLRIDDVAGLPPAYVCVADLDPLRDEGTAFAERLAGASVPVSFRCDEQMLHGYLAFAENVPLAAEALYGAADWLRGHLA